MIPFIIGTLFGFCVGIIFAVLWRDAIKAKKQWNFENNVVEFKK